MAPEMVTEKDKCKSSSPCCLCRTGPVGLSRSTGSRANHRPTFTRAHVSPTHPWWMAQPFPAAVGMGPLRRVVVHAGRLTEARGHRLSPVTSLGRQMDEVRPVAGQGR